MRAPIDLESRRAHGKQSQPADEQIAAVLATLKDSVVVAAEQQEPIAWDLDGMLQSDDAPGCLFGLPSAGKSLLANALCIASVTGNSFLGRTVRKRPSALYVNFDAGEKTFCNRIRRTGGATGYNFIKLRSHQWTPPIYRALMEKHRGGFVVIDCLASIYKPNRNEDPAWDIRNFVEGLRDTYEEFGCGGLVLDHARRGIKGEPIDFYGSVQKSATFRTMWAVSTTGKEPGKHHIKIHCEKQNEGEDFADVNVLADFTGRYVTLSTTTDAPLPDGIADPTLKAVEAWAKKRGAVTFSKQNVKDAVSGRAGTIGTCVDALVATGLFVVVGKVGGGPLLLHAEHSTPVPKLERLIGIPEPGLDTHTRSHP